MLEENLEDWLSESEKIATPVSILVHDLDFINSQLAKSQYFFSDIKRDGILLYGQDLLLKKAKNLSRQDRAKLAQEDFEYWFESANRILETYQFNFDKKYYDHAAFELHQATEKLYTTMLLVYTRYKPNTHDLRKLRKMVNAFDARYKKTYVITQ